MGQSGSSQHRGGGGDKTREGNGTYTPKGDKQSSGEGGGGGGGSTNNATSKTGSSASPQKPPWAAMEGPVYMCDYLGYKTLNKPATSAAALQSTVKDLYLLFRKNLQQGGPLKKSSFKVTPGGLLVSLHEVGGSLEMFFDITCINVIQALRFAVLKGSEKKPKAVFVPLDDGQAPPPPFNADKSAFSLDKSFHFLVQANHQPLLVCVLRRPKGVKALDCHVFAMDSPETVLYVQSCVNRLMTSGGSATGEAAFNRSSTRGDFVRTDFGDYSVYRGGQAQKFELKDEYFRGGAADGGGGGFPPHLDPGIGPRGGGQPSPRETYPAESGERPRFGWSYDKPQSGEDFRRISGQYSGDGGRPSSVELRPSPQQLPMEGRQGSQYYQDSRAGGQFQGDRRSGELGGAGYGQDYRRAEYERAEIVHVRERSGGSGDNRIPGISRQMSSGSDQHAGGGAPISPRSEVPPKVMQKPVSPVRAGSSYGPSGHAPLSPRVSAESPRTPTSPYSPTGPGAGPAFSLSNRESRGDEREQQEAVAHGKPVAKVPPHLKGVKVLPSDFLAVKLKPKQQRSESEESEHGYDNHKNLLAQYKQLQLQEQDAQEGFTGFNDRDMDTSGGYSRSYTNNWNDDGGRASSSYDSQQQYQRRFGGGEEERRYIEQYSEQDTVIVRPHGRYEDPGGKNRHSSPGYGGDSGEGGGGGGGGNWMSKSAYDMGSAQGGHPAPRNVGAPPSSAANDEKQMGRKKDAEIANMFSNFGLQGRQDAFHPPPDGHNFEQSLGYLP